ncbi:hypothetical protein N9K91_04050 [Schleiferiaceae bacterium]|nr:hypothetical protein [Schleiferiaceae bacterium]
MKKLSVYVLFVFALNCSLDNESVGQMDSTEVNSPTKSDAAYNNNTDESLEECLVSYPSNGYSPYDDIYGSGIYHQTENIIEVTSPTSRDIVFLLKDVYTGKIIRNEFIRSNSQFSLTKVPFGKYKFYYTYGTEWCVDQSFKSYDGAGNFSKDYAISKSEDLVDFEFEHGYYGTYTLKLQMALNGNLETESASEDEL